MIDFLTTNPMYVVLTTALIIWLGVAFYVNRVDGAIKRLED
jgi:hypothetical protein